MTPVPRHSKWNKSAKDWQFLEHVPKDCQTLFEAFRKGATLSAGGLCLGWRNSGLLPFQWLTYNEVDTLSSPFRHHLARSCYGLRTSALVC